MEKPKKSSKKKGTKNIDTESKEKNKTKCESTDAEIQKYHKRMFWLKLSEYLSAAVLLLCIFVPLTVVVICQIDSDLQDYKEAATLVSTFTSIILGFVAMTVSLIGMVLSFHNTRQTEDSNLSTTKEFTNLSNSINQLNELEQRLDNNLERISEKINTLDKQMIAFKQLETQIITIQNTVNQTANDIRYIVDREKNPNVSNVQSYEVTPRDAGAVETDG